MPFSDMDFIRHIRDEAKYIVENTSAVEFDDFLHNKTLRRASVRSLEIIGEASKKVSTDFKMAHPQIDWRSMAGMRDKLIHDYFGVDYEIVWDVLKNEIPKLSIEIGNIIKEQKGKY